MAGQNEIVQIYRKDDQDDVGKPHGCNRRDVSSVSQGFSPYERHPVKKKNSETPEDDSSPISAMFGNQDSLKDMGSNLLNTFL